MKQDYSPSAMFRKNQGKVYYNIPTTKEDKANAKAAAAKAGMTLQDYVNEAIMEKIEREGE